ATGKKLGAFAGHRGPVNSLCLTPDGKRLVTGSDDKSVIVWDVKTQKPVHKLAGHTAYVREVAASNTVAVSGSEDLTVRFWDLATGKCTSKHELRGKLSTVAISADGKLAATMGLDNALIVWGVAAGQPQRTPYDAKAGGRDLGKDLGGMYIATKNRTGVGHEEAPRRLAFVGDRLLSVGDEVIEWDLETGKPLRTFARDAWGHKGACVDRAGKLLAVARNGVALWDVAAATRRAALSTEGLQTVVAFSPDGKVLLSGSDGGTIAAWDVAAAPGGGPADHVGRVNQLRAGGRHAASGGLDGRVLVWDLAGAKRVAELDVPVCANGRRFELSPSGKHVATAGDSAFDVWRCAD